MATATKSKDAVKSANTNDFSKAAINARLSRDQKIKLLADMARIRCFESEALQQYQKSKMGGFLHLYNGQESVVVGCASLMGDDDHVITAYRCHGHALAVGMTMNECMAELFGRVTGCSKGKGGSMHFFAPDKNFWGGHGIVAGQTPLGLGLAYALKYKGVKGAAMCFMGDGAVNQGCFFESLNMASLFDIPVVYIIENNGYSMGTSQDRSSAYDGCLAKRAEAFKIAWGQCDGTDIYEVRANVHTALERAKNESRPTVLEIATYRYYGHSVADSKHDKGTEAGGYRCKDEIRLYKDNHDPIQHFKRRLIEEGVINEEQFEQIDDAARAEAEASTQFAEDSPYPSVASIQEDVYFEVDRQTQAGRTGRHFFND